ncbi:hypothetical protein MA16_Dca001656 [Dendrobium catenatum]|uniref:Uncharacterized protein n=1 Tax=Dendrobium catenatum TaxID=906689 RepID=A0A2I0WN10_9ASPA|nr:hypothetical protein MA16_Dca001656 [Dendrobium catenatum]
MEEEEGKKTRLRRRNRSMEIRRKRRKYSPAAWRRSIGQERAGDGLGPGDVGFGLGDRTGLRARPWTGAALGLAGVRECQG